MKILVIGSGGREHAIVWKLKKSKLVSNIYCLPGNAGISQIAQTVQGSVDDIESIKKFAVKNQIDLTIVGPEAPLAQGIVNIFRAEGLQIFGPDKRAAQLEGSKAYAKSFMKTYNIPTAKYAACTTMADAEKYIRSIGAPLVIKASGLAAGKGVDICLSEAEAFLSASTMLEDKKFGESGSEIIIEELLEGEEASIIAFCDGETLFSLAASQDHKRVFNGDQGPNTGGMGAYAPAPVVTGQVMEHIKQDVFKKFLYGIRKEELDFRGIIYFGLMITSKGPRVLEFNVRFGDPEAQVQLPLLDADLVQLIQAVLDKKLALFVAANPHALSSRSAVCVVAASGGYPGSYHKGKKISGLESNDPLIFHAGTSFDHNNYVTSGGRVLGVTAVAQDLQTAIQESYAKMSQIRFEGMHFRTDIGYRALEKIKS
ncbi:MAG: phosphoribosylamine--glycine ligase [bacterium]